MSQKLMIPSPFGFVPFLDKKVERKPLQERTHHHYGKNLLSGELTFTLENLTLMLIASGRDKSDHIRERNEKKYFVESQGKPIIPGSSLKGMIRSTYELMTHSCLMMLNDSYRNTGLNPKEYEPLKSRKNRLQACDNQDELCPACSLFGFISRNSPWKGRVNIGDGLLIEENAEFEKRKALPIQGAPRPKARPTSKHYTDYLPDNELAGRKLYHHWLSSPKTAPIAKTQQARGQRPVEAEPLKAGHHFRFQVTYTNLEEQELAFLLNALLLKEGWAHHLGTAKSFGWGSCKLALESWKEINIKDRYRSMQSGSTDLSAEKIQSRLESFQQYIDPKLMESLQPFLDWEGRESKNYGFYNRFE